MWEAIGTHYSVPSEPIIDENTRYVDAGAIRIGVEYRHPDGARVQQMYEGTPFEEQYRKIMAELPKRPKSEKADAPKRGAVSLHVIDSDTGHEFVRFDCFDDKPHYHYFHPWTKPEDCHNHVVEWDLVALGPMTPWAYWCLRHRLPDMLTEAGGPDVASRLDQVKLDHAVDEVEAIMSDMLAAAS